MWSVVVLAALATGIVLLACGVRLGFVRACRRVLREELAAVAAGAHMPAEGYRRFAARATRNEARAGTVSTWLAAFAVAATYVGLIVIDLAVPAVRPSLPPPGIFLASAWAFYGTCVVLPLAVSETARTFLVDRAALASLAGVVRDPSALLGLTTRADSWCPCPSCSATRRSATC